MIKDETQALGLESGSAKEPDPGAAVVRDRGMALIPGHDGLTDCYPRKGGSLPVIIVITIPILTIMMTSSPPRDQV
jgi:hypothetical protein